MFVPRLISGIVLVLIALVTVNLGGWVLWCVNLFISLVGMMEIYRVFNIHKSVPGVIGYIGVFAYYLIIGFGLKSSFIAALLIITFLILMSYMVVTFPKYKTEEIMTVVFGIIYPGVMLSFMYLLRNLPEGQLLVWLIFLSSWGNDTCAYCVGNISKKLGTTHRMTPVLSPKKSVEGGVGGILGAAILGAVFGLVFDKSISAFSIPVPAACAILCFCGGIIAMLGDLAASAVKRNHNIKDYGHLIPGHGGIMDRFDSIVFAAPVLYFVTLLLQTI